MKTNIIASALIISICSLSGSLICSTQEAAVTIRHLSGTVYFMQCEGGNMALSIGADGVLLVDTDLKRNASRIKEALKSIRDVPVRCVINTHFHNDHVDGNKAFYENATIIAHANTRLFCQKIVDAYDGYHCDPLPQKALPDITFKNEVTIHFNGEAIWSVYMPKGHTNTDVVVWFPQSRVIHIGDIFRNQRLPYLDVTGGGTVRGLMKNLETLLNEIPDDFHIIPGHGTPANKNDLKYYYNKFINAVEHIQKQIDQNKSLEDVKKDGLPAFYDSYPPSGVEPDMWIEIVYRNLKGEI